MQRRRLGNLIAAVVALIAAGCVQPPPVARTPSLPVPAPVY